MMNKKLLLSLCAVCAGLLLQAQINSVSVVPTLIDECDSVSAVVQGDLPATNYFFDSSRVRMNGTNIQLEIYYSSSGFGSPTITPFTHEEELGVFTAATYSLETLLFINGKQNDQDNTNFSVNRSNFPRSVLPADTGSCNRGPITLDATVRGASYVWSTRESTATIQVSSPGTYAVTVTDGACSLVDSVEVSFYLSPVVDLGADTVLTASQTVVLDAGTFASYLWNTGATTQTITVNTTGDYSVTVTDANGCTGSDTISVTYSTGIANAWPDTWQVYPNPVQDQFFLQTDQPIDQLQVINTVGQIVYSESSLTQRQWRISSADWPAGMYWVVIFSEDGRYLYPLVKQ